MSVPRACAKYWQPTAQAFDHRLTRLIAAILSSVLVLVATLSPNAIANSGPPKMIVARYLWARMFTLRQPVYVWSWANDRYWHTPTDPHSSEGYRRFQKQSTLFFEGYCSPNAALNPADCPAPETITADLLYGRGSENGSALYAAADPVATSDFGHDDQWNLMQIQLTPGLRVLDIRREEKLPAPVMAALESLGCNAVKESWNIRRIFSLGARGQPFAPVSDTCAVGMRSILKDILKIDAFAYDYSSAEFSECDDPRFGNNLKSDLGDGRSQNPSRNTAFVITSGKHIAPTQVMVFNSSTREAREDRVRIQSLFYKADVDFPARVALGYYYKIAQSKTAPVLNAGFIDGASQTCTLSSDAQSQCEILINFCGRNGECRDLKGFASVPPPTIPFKLPVTMQSASTPMSLSMRMQMEHLLWADLEGVAPDLNLGVWVTQNLFGCQPRSSRFQHHFGVAI